MNDRIRFVASMEEGLALIAGGQCEIISRVPLDQLFARAWHVQDCALDFDGTVVPASQWRAMGSIMTPECRSADLDNYAWYNAHRHEPVSQDIQVDDPDWWIGHMDVRNLTTIDGAWVTSAIALLNQSGVRLDQVEAVAKTLEPRDGILALIRMMRMRAIITFGVEQFIQSWLRYQQVPAVMVAAARLICDPDGRVSRPHINVVGSGSKQFAVERFCQVARINPHELLVMGDTVVDMHMMLPESFNVLIVPPSEVDKKMQSFRENNLSEMWDRLTCILACDSVGPLIDLLHRSRRLTR